MTVYRIVNDAGVMVSAAGWPDDTAVYRNAAKIDREIRRMNDPDWPYPGHPKPKGGPFRRQVGEIHWEESCSCFAVPEERWTRYGDAVEPGSMMKPNPECRAHFNRQDYSAYRPAVVREIACAGRDHLMNTLEDISHYANQEDE